MSEWPKSRLIAAQYQSPFFDGIGFAQYASTGTVTPELWENIKRIESDAQSDDPSVEGWAADMVALRQALAEEGVWQMQTVTFEWSTEKGACDDCGLPAAYRLVNVGHASGGSVLLCSVDAAYHAAHGDEIEYLFEEENE